MTLLPLSPESMVQVRPSARVAVVARLLDCHATDIRRLIDSGELEAHRKGVRGIRVFLDSVQKYQERRVCLPKAARALVKPTAARKSLSRTAHRDALNCLKAKGLI